MCRFPNIDKHSELTRAGLWRLSSGQRIALSLITVGVGRAAQLTSRGDGLCARGVSPSVDVVGSRKEFPNWGRFVHGLTFIESS